MRNVDMNKKILLLFSHTHTKRGIYEKSYMHSHKKSYYSENVTTLYCFHLQVLNFANEQNAKYQLKHSTLNLDLICHCYLDHYWLTDTCQVLFAEFNPMMIFCHMRFNNMS